MISGWTNGKWINFLTMPSRYNIYAECFTAFFPDKNEPKHVYWYLNNHFTHVFSEYFIHASHVLPEMDKYGD